VRQVLAGDGQLTLVLASGTERASVTAVTCG
jgi:hypothetical protein